MTTAVEPIPRESSLLMAYPRPKPGGEPVLPEKGPQWQSLKRRDCVAVDEDLMRLAEAITRTPITSFPSTQSATASVGIIGKRKCPAGISPIPATGL